MLAQVRLLPLIGKTVTLTLATASVTGILREITPDLVILEAGLETGSDDEAETLYVFLPQVLAIRVAGTQGWASRQI